jgi:uncharacterized protein (UPF0264 family)
MTSLRRRKSHADPLRLILEGMKKMSAELDRLTAAVAAEKTADASILALVKGLSDQLRAAATDPAKITALADSLDADQAEIAAAVAANATPAPTPPAPPAA